MNKKEKPEVEKPDANVSIRMTHEQIEKLKFQASKENRSISNYIKTKLF